MKDSHRERDIFEAAMDITSPKARDIYLQQACGEDSALLQRILALLRVNESMSGFLPGVSEQLPFSVEAASTSEGPGTVIGRYKLLEPIGEGGFGFVYMAEQTEPVKRRVALKIIKPGMDSKQVIGRFEVERQALALMDHPNIARIFDAGTTDGRAGDSACAGVEPIDSGSSGNDTPFLSSGRPYFVMELVNGVPITKFCEKQKLDTEARLNLFMEVCDAVQHAHQKGVIHRDLKPSNILVTLQGAKPTPKVIDFGIAKATEQPLTDKTVLTHFQQFMGTPAYMSPEQAALSGLDVDTRSDIYSLGVLLYEILTGGPPFDTKELMSSGLDEMRRIIREKEPERPSTKLNKSRVTGKGKVEDKITPPTRLPAFASDLDWIVMKALEKDRDRRYKTANGLARDIQRYISAEPILARPPSAVYRLGKFVRRHRALMISGAAITVLLIAATIVSSTLAHRLKQLNLRVTSESEVNTAMLGFFTHDLIGQDGARLSQVGEMRLKDAVRNASSVVNKRFPDRPDIERRIRIKLGEILHSLGQPKEAREEFRRALKLPVIGGADSTSKDRALLLSSIAQCSFTMGDYEDAVVNFRAAQASAGPSLSSGGRFDIWLKMVERMASNWTEPEVMAEQLMESLDSMNNTYHDPQVRPRWLLAIIGVQIEFDEYEGALRGLLQLLRNEDRTMKPVAPPRLSAYAFFAEVKSAMKDIEGARELIDEVMEIHALSSTNAPPSFYTRIKGRILTEAGELEAGEKCLREALAAPVRPGHERAMQHDRIWRLLPLAWNLVCQNRFEEAEPLVKEAFVLASESELRPSDEALVTRTAAAVAGAKGQWRRALNYCEQASVGDSNAARRLILRCQLGEEGEFLRDRKRLLEAVSDLDDRLLLSSLLRVAALQPATSSDEFVETVPILADRLKSHIPESSSAMQDELFLALTAASFLTGNYPSACAWSERVSTQDPLIHAQATLVRGRALQAEERFQEARDSLLSAERKLPFLTETSPDLKGARWEDQIMCYLLHQYLSRELDVRNISAPSMPK